MGSTIVEGSTDTKNDLNLIPALIIAGIWLGLIAVTLTGNLDLLTVIPTSHPVVGFSIAMGMGSGLTSFYMFYSLTIRNYRDTSRLMAFYTLISPLGLLAVANMPFYIAIYLLVLFLGSTIGGWIGHILGKKKSKT